MFRIRKTPAERELNDVFEVELNFIGSKGIRESIERLLQLRFQIFEDGNGSLDSRLVDYAARPVREQTNVFVKFNVKRQFHGLPLEAGNLEVSRSSGTPSHFATSFRC